MTDTIVMCIMGDGECCEKTCPMLKSCFPKAWEEEQKYFAPESAKDIADAEEQAERKI